MADFEDIRRQVVDAGGVKCFRMEEIRKAGGYGKLGPGVIEDLSSSLGQKNLGHTPNPMSRYQEKRVYVYDRGSGAGQLMAAVTGEPSEDGAAAIRDAVEANGAESAQGKLDELKKLVIQMNDVFKGPTDDESGSAS